MTPTQVYVTNDHRYPPGAMRSVEEYLRRPWANVVMWDGHSFREAAGGIQLANGANAMKTSDLVRARMEELSEQMQSSQRVAWADNAIKLAVEMTVASIGRLELSGGPDEQAIQVRDAIRSLFPEAVTLVREAREGLS